MTMTQQTFTPKHWREVIDAFAGCLDTDVLVTLYRASHSATFAEDFRELIEQIVKPERLT